MISIRSSLIHLDQLDYRIEASYVISCRRSWSRHRRRVLVTCPHPSRHPFPSSTPDLVHWARRRRGRRRSYLRRNLVVPPVFADTRPIQTSSNHLRLYSGQASGSVGLDRRGAGCGFVGRVRLSRGRAEDGRVREINMASQDVKPGDGK